MKLFVALAALLSLSSCNTTIGFGRDLKYVYGWSGRKIQETRQNQGGGGGQQSQGNSGAPIY